MVLIVHSRGDLRKGKKQNPLVIQLIKKTNARYNENDLMRGMTGKN